ncbi:MAG: radical SAM protein [Thermotogae bacterium]|nr:radical SAM protein [Thermotogota bacterium]
MGNKNSFSRPFSFFLISPEGMRLSNSVLNNNLERRAVSRSTELRDVLLPEFQRHVETRKKLKCWVDNLKGPIFIAIDVTYRCNLHCPYCYLGAGERRLAPILSFENFKYIIDTLIEKSEILGLCLCGGEPTLHPNLKDMISYAKEYGLIVNMVTNGTLINKKLAKDLSSLEIDSVQVSLDGSKPEIMDRLRGKGIFKRAVNAIRTLIANNVTTVAAMTLTKLNINDFPNVAKLSEELGLYSLRTMFFIPEHKRHIPLIPSDEEYAQVIQWIKDNQKHYKCLLEFGDPTEHIVLGPYIGHVMISVNPEGYILPSPYMSLAYGNILNDSWDDLWEELERLWSDNPVFNTISKLLRNEKDFVILSRVGLNRNENENIIDVRRLSREECIRLAKDIEEVLKI